MRKLLFVTTIIFTHSLVIGQVPGYQGKRASVQFNLNTFPALTLMNYNGNGGVLSGGNFGMNTRYAVNLDYVIAREATIGLTGQYYRSNPSLFFEKQNNKDRLTGQAFGAYTKLFSYQSSGSIAPVGQYYKFELLVMPYKTSLWSQRENILGDTTYFYKESTHVTLGFTFTAGKQLIVFDHLILDSGLQLGVVPSGMKYIAGIDTRANEAKTRLLTHFLFNIHLGIGFMAF